MLPSFPVLLRLGPESFFSKEKTGKKRKSMYTPVKWCRVKRNHDLMGGTLWGVDRSFVISLAGWCWWLADVFLLPFFDCSFDKN
ncbi:hypothetical protein EG352_06505 [Chryseobacterium indologenes]|uniref:Uncharacterized protein n=1 Tax=Chryseobacterium indologenes TaxID=253 RepID=A0AAD1DU52_CHRID|nr:hypothetical protein EG352_06505 [Chryseobacterium indologenes]